MFFCGTLDFPRIFDIMVAVETTFCKGGVCHGFSNEHGFLFRTVSLCPLARIPPLIPRKEVKFPLSTAEAVFSSHKTLNKLMQH